jgi:hypothetical protein
MTAYAPAISTRRRAPAAVSLVIGSFVAAIALTLLARHGGVLRVAFPIATVALALWIYRRAGFPSYLAFAWWTWLLVPGLRRIVDYQAGGWDAENPMSLTPFMVSAVAAIVVFRRLPELRRLQFWPWAVGMVCIVFGYFVGILREGPLPATHSLIAWGVPLLFGLAMAFEWRQYPECVAAINRTFVWGAILLSAYAIVQFVAPPGWDRLWVESAGMRSVGTAFPFRIRTFSLMNGPFSFAIFLVAAILLLFSQRGAWRMVAIVGSIAALLLTLVRSAWLALVLGLTVYLITLPLRSIRRAVIACAVAFALLWSIPPLLPGDLGGPVVQMIRARALTLGSLDQDLSYSERTNFVDQMSGVVLQDPLGHGLGSTGVSSALGDPGSGIKDFDSGIFAVLYSLGWVGGAGFLVATGSLVLLCLVRREAPSDLTAKSARAALVASFALSLGGNVFEGVSAVIFWSCAGLLVAAGRWHLSPQQVVTRSSSR